MSGFSAEWLSLRESHDLRARNRIVLDAVATTFHSRDAIGIVDLACGTGSTVRALGPHLPARQHWDLVDNDPRLLAIASSSSAIGSVRLNAVELDLAHSLEPALDRAKDLVTTSALLDLVSHSWLERLARHASACGLPFYAALTYDGRVDVWPADAFDEAVVSALNAHQRTDKGFGSALGPSAAGAAVQVFESFGYSIVQGPSDWMIEPAEHAMQFEFLGGWAMAARESGRLSRSDVDAWLTRRRDAIIAGVSRIRVGHVDFFATPMVTR